MISKSGEASMTVDKLQASTAGQWQTYWETLKFTSEKKSGITTTSSK